MPVEVDMPPEPECGFRSCIGLDPFPAAVDILFVIDDGPTMAQPQVRLREALPAFARAFSAVDRRLDVRVGFVRSSVDHPACEEATGGSLELPEACGLAGDWIDRTFGVGDSDVEELAAALTCAMPMSTDGCAFQSPLGAVERVMKSSEFFREPSAALIVLLGDSFDCSAGPNPKAFDPEGERALWSDATAEAPTPAVCWRGGTQCWLDDAGAIERCESAELDELGVRTEIPSEATLEPVHELERTIVDLISADFALGAPAQRLLVIGGVPAAFEIGDDYLPAADADPEQQAMYGIGPGCAAHDVVARPPIRQLELLDAIGWNGVLDAAALSSICSPDYSAPLADLAAVAIANAEPSCFLACAADVDASEAGLQTKCQFQYRDFERGELLLPTCEEGVMPEGPPVCVQLRADDTLHPACAERGWNLEIELVWSGPVPSGSTILPVCELSDDRDRDCPNLPG